VNSNPDIATLAFFAPSINIDFIAIKYLVTDGTLCIRSAAYTLFVPRF